MKKLVAILVGASFLFGVAGMGVSSEKKDAKKDNATANATKANATKKEAPAPKKKKIEGC